MSLSWKLSSRDPHLLKDAFTWEANAQSSEKNYLLLESTNRGSSSSKLVSAKSCTPSDDVLIAGPLSPQ